MTAPRRLSVLVVDDDPDAAESTADLCRRFGHAARFALGGEEGLALAAAAPPGVVLVDLRMPGLDGCEVARRLAAPGHGRPPVLIAYTSAAGTPTGHGRGRPASTSTGSSRCPGRRWPGCSAASRPR